MSKPPFVMSKYITLNDLLIAKAKYYRELSDEFRHGNALLENALRDLINDCINFSEAVHSDCILKQAIDTLSEASKGGSGVSNEELYKLKMAAVNWINQNIWDGEEPPETSYAGFSPAELKEFVAEMLEDIIEKGE